jgi:hypothetical protein
MSTAAELGSSLEKDEKRLAAASAAAADFEDNHGVGGAGGGAAADALQHEHEVAHARHTLRGVGAGSESSGCNALAVAGFEQISGAAAVDAQA